MALAVRAVRRLARSFGYDLTRTFAPGADCIDLMVRLRWKLRHGENETKPFLRFCLEHLTNSRSDALQDLFALHETGCRHGGVFVEFGAADGIINSNSYMLEAGYDWTGLLAEPAWSWHAELTKNRRCIIDRRCVAGRSGDEVLFRDCAERALSTIDSYAHADRYHRKRRRATRYTVETVSLNDLLDQHGLDTIDYLSIDTEGSELMILASFDFGRFRPQVITVEHAYEPQRRAALFDLLSTHGYRRKYESLSQIDDWYVRG
jgi:FkbM family methyltransferase